MTSTLYGHIPQKDIIYRLQDEGTLPHALMLAGPKGIGKATFALHVVSGLLKAAAHAPDPNQSALFGDLPEAAGIDQESFFTLDTEEPATGRLMNGSHPDALRITPEEGKSLIEVAQIRKIGSFLSMSASEGGWRTVIIDDADTMNRNAQNALLKILEEPPARTLIILVAHRKGVFLPTIHSRCRTLDFQMLEASDVAELIRAEMPNASNIEVEQAVAYARGSVGAALDFLEQGGSELAQQLDTLSTIPDVELLKWADTIIKNAKSEGLVLFSSLYMGAIHQIARQASAPVEEALKVWDNVSAMLNAADQLNLDKRHAVYQALISLKTLKTYG